MNESAKTYSFFVESKDVNIPGRVYLGVFLAFIIFFSFILGYILFFLIVILLTALIFLSKESDEGIHVDIYPDRIIAGRTVHKFSDLLSYSFVDQVFDRPKDFLRLTFKSSLFQDVYIDLPKTVEKQRIRDIIAQSLREEKDVNITLVDEIILGFFH